MNAIWVALAVVGLVVYVAVMLTIGSKAEREARARGLSVVHAAMLGLVVGAAWPLSIGVGLALIGIDKVVDESKRRRRVARER